MYFENGNSSRDSPSSERFRLGEGKVYYVDSEYLPMAATTTVRISSRASRKLDELQARVQERSGKRMTKQSILEDLVERALMETEPLILLPAPRKPLSRRAMKALLEYPVDWGVETREEDIDAILYGDED